MGSDSHDIDTFLAAHAPVESSATFAPGEVFGDWRVTAFLGRGGSGEVYRVVHTTLGTSAALKVCVKNPERDAARDEAVCTRFRREAKLLAENKHPAFPCFLGFGEREGRPWYVMELLEYRPLPTTEREIARFLLAVASGVQHLHSQGIIHRDIKPGNILWRRVKDNAPYHNVGQATAAVGVGRAAGPQAAATRERFDNVGRAACPQAAAEASPVLIDLGLAKDLSAVRGHAGESLSIVDGKALGVGTPRYAAPEQMSGDAVSPATDVYALGMLANDCFGGKPPRAWRHIIQRATAAIPAQRYATVAAFTRAIRLLRARYWIRGTLAVALTVSVLTLWTFSRKGENSPLHAVSATNPVTLSPTTETPSERSAWQELCRNFTTNIVTRHTEMRRPDAVKRMSPAEFTMRANEPQYRPVLVSRAETNKIDATMVNLGGRTVLFNEPINLDAGREYWIVGPGVLDAQFSASSTATVRIANCIFRNRTKTSPFKAGIDYVLDGGAYLNFTDLPSTEAMKQEVGGRVRSNGMSEGRRWWRIKGPDDIAELVDDKPNSSNYSATMESF